MASFRRLFNSRRRPVKRITEYEVDEGDTPTLPVRSENWWLSDEGSIDRTTFTERRYYATCGCTTEIPAGGRCSICDGTACAMHWYPCARCGRGTCGRHSQVCGTAVDSPRMCPECALWTAPGRGIARALGLLRGE
jgi:hypothetical protein